MSLSSTEPVRVLHVDDAPEFADVTAAFLEHEDDRFIVETATNAREGLDRLAGADFDCIVSDYDMPEMDGIEFLTAVRAEYPDLPFILFTGKGSEEVASEAMAAGVTDYLQKDSGSSQYTILANRIGNAVASYRAQRRLAVQKAQYQRLLDRAPLLYVVTRNRDGEPLIEDCNQGFLDHLGYTREEVIDHPLSSFYTADSTKALLEDDGYERALTGEFDTAERSFVTATGNEVPTLLRAVPRVDDEGTTIGTLALYVDISERKEREREREREQDRIAAAFDAAPYPLVHVRFEDGEPIVQRINDAFEEVFGFEKQVITGSSLDEHIVPDRDVDDARVINERTRDSEQVEKLLVRETADGDEREFLFKSAPITRGDGPTEGMGAYVDITERKKRVEELERENQ